VGSRSNPGASYGVGGPLAEETTAAALGKPTNGHGGSKNKSKIKLRYQGFPHGHPLQY
jgi:hypothetical protein